MRSKLPSSSLVHVAATGFVLGLFGTALWSSDNPRLRAPALAELGQLTRMEPIRVLPRAELLLVAAEARTSLAAGRPWAAWNLLQEHLGDPTTAPSSVVVLAARAAGEWGGWSHVRDLLQDSPMLTQAEGGEGLFLLGRAEEELGNLASAAKTYQRYLAVPNIRQRALAQARLGRILRQTKDPRAAAASFAAAAPQLAEIEDWLHVLQLEQLARAEDPAVAQLATRGVGGSSPVRLRRVRAEVEGWIEQGDLARAIRRLEWEARVLAVQGSRAEAAQLQIERARLLLRGERAAAARDLLRSTAWETTVPKELRVVAAHALGEMNDRTVAEELARAAAFEAGGKPGLAAKALRAALKAGAPDDGGVQLRLAHLLYAERDYNPARAAFQRAAEQLRDREKVAEAELFAARALFRTAPAASSKPAPAKSKTKAKAKAKAKPKAKPRPRRGPSPRDAALAEFRRIAEKYEGTAAAGSALFLLGDEAANLRSAVSYYRRAADVSHSGDAREALFRVGDRSLKLKDTAAALEAWQKYVERYPRGEETARVAYEAGKLHESANRDARAREMYAAAVRADPVSYYALRAANRLGIDPLEPVFAEPRPWVGLAADPKDAASVLRRLDALASVGLTEEREEELSAAIRNFEQRPLALLVLAEGLRDRGATVEAIRLGRKLLSYRGGEWDERLLRVVFPLPYRKLLEEEADRMDVDPMLLAGLVRQESSFQSDARSWVGATGLGQVMPATGRWLAPSVGVRRYEDHLLKVPEVNLRMAAKYLGDLLDRYDGARDLALAGYNAGPGRADRWRRELRHGRDTDAFREAIPFDETRNYVKVVLRNAVIYQRLYGRPKASGLVRIDD